MDGCAGMHVKLRRVICNGRQSVKVDGGDGDVE